MIAKNRTSSPIRHHSTRGHNITSVCWSGRLLVEVDRASVRRYSQPQDGGRYLLFRDPLGHLVLSATPGLLRSCEPPKANNISSLIWYSFVAVNRPDLLTSWLMNSFLSQLVRQTSAFVKPLGVADHCQ